MNISIRSLIVAVTFSLFSINTHCVDSNLREEETELQPRTTIIITLTQRRAARATARIARINAQIERRVRNQWVDHLSEEHIRTLVASEQSNFALRQATRLHLPVVPTALLRNAENNQLAAVNVVRYVLGTNSQPASEESKTA